MREITGRLFVCGWKEKQPFLLLGNIFHLGQTVATTPAICVITESTEQNIIQDRINIISGKCAMSSCDIANFPEIIISSPLKFR